MDQTFLLMILMLRFTASGRLSSFTVAVRDDVTLSCENASADQDQCQNTTWLLQDPGSSRTDAVVERGRTEASTAHRRRLTEKCSLLIEKVTVQDVGRYTCTRGAGASEVYLSVVHMDEYEAADEVYVYCYVSTHKHCEPSVKWLHHSQVFTSHRDVKASHTLYYAVVSLLDSHRVHASVMNSLTCEVTDCFTNVHRFPFRPPASDENVTFKETTIEDTSIQNTTSASDTTLEDNGWWRIIIVSVALTTLIVIVVVVNVWTRTKGNKRVRDENTVSQ
ncbi:uncharacterized protein LOC114850137 [Betta splendens]|uniref:Uncharacterized protein LOC114850137 n=1 Tax=Betta splendens TaxID=158456 RepID=A0A8M1HAE5_BETSP|nr:uncharacterized protein LOC114850137 [Betta splendens]